MSKTHVFIACLASCTLWYCTTAPLSKAAQIKVESQKISRTFGNCQDTTAFGSHKCAKVDLRIPIIVEGPDALKVAVKSWTEDAQKDALLLGEDASGKGITIDQAMQNLGAQFQEMAKEFPDQSGWEIILEDTVLYSSPRWITLELRNYSYTGGAHPNHFTARATFDAVSGKETDLRSLITDSTAVKTLLEKAYRAEKIDAFQEGFEFDETFQFEIAQEIGLTPEGLSFYYNPYEVAPYAIGDAECTLTWDQLTGLVNPIILPEKKQ